MAAVDLGLRVLVQALGVENFRRVQDEINRTLQQSRKTAAQQMSQMSRNLVDVAARSTTATMDIRDATAKIAESMYQTSASSESISTKRIQDYLDVMRALEREMLDVVASAHSLDTAFEDYESIKQRATKADRAFLDQIRTTIIGLEDMRATLTEVEYREKEMARASKGVEIAMKNMAIAAQYAAERTGLASRIFQAVTRAFGRDTRVNLGVVARQMIDMARQSGLLTQGIVDLAASMHNLSSEAGRVTPEALSRFARQLRIVGDEILRARAHQIGMQLTFENWDIILKSFSATEQEFISFLRGTSGELARASRNILQSADAHELLSASTERSAGAARSAQKAQSGLTSSTRGATQALKDQQKQTQRTMWRLGKLGSTAQGVMLGFNALQGSVQGLLFGLAFLQFSMTKISVPVAALTIAIGGLSKAVSTLGRSVEDVTYRFRQLTGSLHEGVRAWQIATRLSLRYGRSLDDVSDALATLREKGVLTQDMVRAAFDLAGARKDIQGVAQAAEMLAEAIGRDRENLDALQDLGIKVVRDLEGGLENLVQVGDQVVDITDRQAVSMAVATAVMSRYKNAAEEWARTGVGASRRILESLKSILSFMTAPLWNDLLVPLLNTLADAANHLAKVVYSFTLSEQVVAHWRKTIALARDTMRKYRDELKLLGRFVERIFLGLMWSMLTVVRLLVVTFRKFMSIVRGAANALRAFGRILKPVWDMLRMLAQGLKALNLTIIMEGLKEFALNGPALIRAAIAGILRELGKLEIDEDILLRIRVVLSSNLDNIKFRLRAFRDDIVKAIIDMLDDMSQAFQRSRFGQYLDDLFDDISQRLEQFRNDIETHGFARALRQLLDDAVHEIRTSRLAGSLQQLADDIVQSLDDIARNVRSSRIVQAFRSLGKSIRDTLKNPRQAIIDFLDDIATRLTGQIVISPDLSIAIRGLLDDIVRTIRNSKVGQTIGRFINGIKNSFTKFQVDLNLYGFGEAVRNLLDDMVRVFSQTRVGKVSRYFVAAVRDTLNDTLLLFRRFRFNLTQLGFRDALSELFAEAAILLQYNPFFIALERTRIGQILINIVKRAISRVPRSFSDLVKAIGRALIGLPGTVEGIFRDVEIKLWGALARFDWNTIIGFVRRGIGRITKTLLRGAGDLGKTALKVLWELGIKLPGRIWAGIVKKAPSLAKKLPGLLKGIFRGGILAAIEAIPFLIIDAMGRIIIDLSPLQEKVKEELEHVWDFTMWGTAIGALGGPIGMAIGALAGTVVGYIDEKLGHPIREKAQEIWERFASALREAGGRLKATIENMFGIDLDATFESIKNFFADVGTIIKHFLGIGVDTDASRQLLPFLEKAEQARFRKALDNMKQRLDTFANTLINLFNTVKDKVLPIWNRFKQAWSDYQVWDKVKAVFSTLGQVFNILWEQIKQAWPGIKDALGELWESVKNVLPPLGELTKIAAEGLAIALSGLVTLLGSFAGGAIRALPGLIRAAAGALQVLGDILGAVVNIGRAFIEGFRGVFAMLRGDFGAAFEHFGKGGEHLINAFGDIKDAVGGLTDVLGGIWDAAKGFVSGAWDAGKGIIDAFKDLKYKLIGDPIVGDIVDGVINFFKGMFSKLTGKIFPENEGGVLGFFKGLFSKLIDKIFPEYEGGILGFFKDLFSKLTDEILPESEGGILDFFKELGDKILSKIDFEAILKQGFEALNKWLKDNENKRKLKAIGEKVVELIKEGIKSATLGIIEKLSETPRDALNWVRREAYNLTQVGEDIVKYIRDGILNVDPGIGEKFNSIMDSIDDWWIQAKDQLLEFGKRIMGKILEGIQSIDLGLSGFTAELTNWITRAQTWVSEHSVDLRGIGESIVGFIDEGFAGLNNILSDIETWVSNLSDAFSGISVPQALQDVVNSITSAIGNLASIDVDANKIMGILRIISEAIKGWVTTLSGLTAESISAVHDLADKIGQIISSIATGVGSITSQTATRIRDVIETIADGISNWWNKLDNLGVIAQKVWDGIVIIGTIVSDIYTSLQGVASDTAENIRDALRWISQGIKNFYDNLPAQEIAAGIQGSITWIRDIASSIYNVFKNITSDTAKAVKNALRWVGEGIDQFYDSLPTQAIAAGIRGAVTWIKDTVNSIYTALKDITSDVARGIKNVFRWIGQGVEDFYESLPTGGVSDIVKRTIDWIKDTVVLFYNALSGIASDVVRAITNAISGIGEAIADFWDALSNFDLGLLDDIVGQIISIIQRLIGVVSGNNANALAQSNMSALGQLAVPAGQPIALPDAALSTPSNVSMPLHIHVSGNYILDERSARGLADVIGDAVIERVARRYPLARVR